MPLRQVLPVAGFAAALAAAAPTLAYKESVESQGSRFDFLSELSYVGEDKPLLLRNCDAGGPSGVRFLKIRQYYDRRTDTHLWVITTEKHRDILYYVSAGRLSCVIEQQ